MPRSQHVRRSRRSRRDGLFRRAPRRGRPASRPNARSATPALTRPGIPRQGSACSCDENGVDEHSVGGPEELTLRDFAAVQQDAGLPVLHKDGRHITPRRRACSGGAHQRNPHGSGTGRRESGQVMGPCTDMVRSREIPGASDAPEAGAASPRLQSLAPRWSQSVEPWHASVTDLPAGREIISPE